MSDNMDSVQKRNSIKKNYDLIAEQYSKDFGTYIEDLDVYDNFEKYLSKGSAILDLGAGTGRTYAYFNQKGYKYIGLDFSSKMKDYAYRIHGEFPYIVDDMVNIKNYFDNNSIDSIFAVYSLFHLPKDNFKEVLSDIYNILKVNGVFLFSYQIGDKDEFVDEPYLGENGKNVLYMNYHTKDEIKKLLNLYGYEELYEKEKIENSSKAINSNSAVTVYKIVRKIK